MSDGLLGKGEMMGDTNIFSTVMINFECTPYEASLLMALYDAMKHTNPGWHMEDCSPFTTDAFPCLVDEIFGCLEEMCEVEDTTPELAVKAAAAYRAWLTGYT